MANFDWNKYETEEPSGSSFDWDAYDVDEQEKQSKPSQSQAIMHGLEQGATLGFFDELAGGVEGVGQAVGLKGLGGPIKDIELTKPTFFDTDAFKKAYRERRDKIRQETATAREAHPGTMLAGEVVGSLATGKLPIGSVNTLRQAAKTGAILGGAAGFGSSEADNVKDMAIDTATGAGFGGVLGAGGHAIADKAGKAVDKAKQWAGEKLKDVAETSAFKSSGAMLKDFRTADARGKIKEYVRYILDQLGLKPGETVENIATKSAAKREVAGDVLDEIYGRAQDVFSKQLQSVGFDPKRDKAAVLAAAERELGDAVGAKAALKRLGNYLDELAAKHGDKPTEEAQKAYQKELADYFPKFRQYLRDRLEFRRALGKAADDPTQPVLPGMVDDLQRTATKPTQVELRGPDPEIMRSAPPEPLTQQPFLPDLPTGETEVNRLLRRVDEPDFGELGGAAVDRVGRRVADQLEKQAQLDFLNQNTTEQLSMFGRQGEIVGTGLTPRMFAEIEMPAVAAMPGQTRIPIEPMRPMRPTPPPDIRNPMSPRRAQEVKSAIDDRINYSRNPLTREPETETAFSAARRYIADKIDDQMRELGDDALANELRAANKEYGNAAEIARIARDRANRENANRMFGLTDTIMAASGGVAGIAGSDDPTVGAASALLAGLANRTARTRGASALAVSADRVSKMLLRSRPMQELAQRNPGAFRAMVIDLTRRIESNRQALPRAAENELDRDSSAPSNERVSSEKARQLFIDGN